MIGKTILIVDDDRHVLMALTARMKSAGYRVVAATDAISAVTTACKESPDLVVLDLGLPAGDGFAVLERMRAMPNLAPVPVIVLSGQDPIDNRQRCLDAGAVAFFQKPPDNREFFAAIRLALGETNGLSTFLQT
jgi:two-component system KDP operon response regulator KdpE